MISREIVGLLDDVLGAPVTDIPISTFTDGLKTDYRKVVENGKIVIVRGRQKFNLSGVEIK